MCWQGSTPTLFQAHSCVFSKDAERVAPMQWPRAKSGPDRGAGSWCHHHIRDQTDRIDATGRYTQDTTKEGEVLSKSILGTGCLYGMPSMYACMVCMCMPRCLYGARPWPVVPDMDMVPDADESTGDDDDDAVEGRARVPERLLRELAGRLRRNDHRDVLAAVAGGIPGAPCGGVGLEAPAHLAARRITRIALLLLLPLLQAHAQAHCCCLYTGCGLARQPRPSRARVVAVVHLGYSLSQASSQESQVSMEALLAMLLALGPPQCQRARRWRRLHWRSRVTSC